MSSVVDLATREERPPYVRFERRAVEDKAASLAAGHWVGKDVDYVKITPAYTKDVIVRDVAGWFEKLKQDERNGRVPNTWIPYYQRAYKAWQDGQEPPIEGTPIRGWSVISPAQQEMLCGLQILTVEDLARLPEDSFRRVGMGAAKLKNLAIAAVKAAKEHGPLVMENAEMKAALELANANIKTLTAQVNDLKAMVDRGATTMTVETPAVEINASDLMDDAPPSAPAPVSRPQTLGDLSLDDLKLLHKEKFGQLPRGQISRETLISKLAA